MSAFHDIETTVDSCLLSTTWSCIISAGPRFQSAAENVPRKLCHWMHFLSKAGVASNTFTLAELGGAAVNEQEERGSQKKWVSFISHGRIHFNHTCVSETERTANYETSVLRRQTMGKRPWRDLFWNTVYNLSKNANSWEEILQSTIRVSQNNCCFLAFNHSLGILGSNPYWPLFTSEMWAFKWKKHGEPCFELCLKGQIAGSLHLVLVPLSPCFQH